MVDKLRNLEEFFATRMWFTEFEEPIRLTGVSIKVEPTGYLVILKGITAEGPRVAFVGVKQLDLFRRIMLGQVDHKVIKWRLDRFAIDEKAQSA